MWVPFPIHPWDYLAHSVKVGWYLRQGSTLDMRKTFKSRRQAWAVCRRLNSSMKGEL
jgi:hypothetical protein